MFFASIAPIDFSSARERITQIDQQFPPRLCGRGSTHIAAVGGRLAVHLSLECKVGAGYVLHDFAERTHLGWTVLRMLSLEHAFSRTEAVLFGGHGLGRRAHFVLLVGNLGEQRGADSLFLAQLRGGGFLGLSGCEHRHYDKN